MHSILIADDEKYVRNDINTPIDNGIIFFLVSFFHLIIKKTIKEGIIEKKLEK